MSQDSHLTRRDFGMLTAAAIGGVLAGCEQKNGNGRDADQTPRDRHSGSVGDTADVSLLLEDPNVCCGLNICKGHGKGEHECAGLSTCATANEQTCGGDNNCKGQGGCGQTAGRNSCKGKGRCAVPLNARTWKKVRAAFETAYEQKHGNKPGGPPEACAQAKG